MLAFLKILTCILAAIGYRLRGSAGEGGWVERLFGFAPGTFLGRFFWCIPVSVLVCGMQWALYPFILAASYVGAMFGYWGGQFDLSRPENRNWKNYGILTLRGMFIATPVCIALAIAQKLGFYDGGTGWGGIVAGALFVPCYLLGLPIHREIKLPLLHQFTEWGELLLGGCVIAGLAWTV